MRHTLAKALLALMLPFSLAAAPVALVLQEDPPLPGEPLAGWEALEPSAPSGEALALAQAIELTLSRSPELQALRAEVAGVQGELLSARALPNPTWELELLSSSAGKASRAPANLSAELELTEILHGRLNAAAVRPEIDAARLRLKEAAIRLRYEAEAAWFETWAARAAWDLSLRAVDALAASRDAQRAITAAGNAPTRELVLKEIAYDEARLRAAGLEMEFVAARERLARLLGQDPGPLAPAPPLVALSLPEDLEQLAVARSLELQAMDLEIEAAQRRRAAARAEGLTPDLGVRLETERWGTAWNTTAGLELSVPMVSFGYGASVSASAEIERQLAQRRAMELRVRSAAREARARFESSMARARHTLEVLVPAREALLAETLLHYNAMQLGLDALLEAWRGRVEIEIAAADALREAHTARAALEALLAGALVDAPRAATTPTNSKTSGGH